MNLLYRPMQVGTSLIVDIHHHGSQFGGLLDIAFRFHNHEVYVQRFGTSLGHIFKNGESEGDVRDKDPIHHIQMKPVGFTPVNHLKVFFKVQEICSKQ